MDDAFERATLQGKLLQSSHFGQQVISRCQYRRFAKQHISKLSPAVKGLTARPHDVGT